MTTADVKGTTRQALENRAKEIAEEAATEFTGRTYSGLEKRAYSIWQRPENSGTAWNDVKDELRKYW